MKTPSLTEFPFTSQRTSAKAPDMWLMRHTRETLLELSSSLDGRRMFSSGAAAAASKHKSSSSTSAERPSSPPDNYITVWICISNFIHLFTHQHLQRDLHLHQTTILQSEYVFQTLYISSHINICRETFISTRQLYYSLNMYFKLYTSLHTSTSAERPSSPPDNYITVWICISNFIHLVTHHVNSWSSLAWFNN